MVTGLVAVMVALAGAPATAATSTSQTTVGIIVTGAPALTVTKRGTVVDAGHDDHSGAGRVRWTITVSNTGNTMLSGLSVSDPTAGPVRCPTTSLVPQQVVICTAPDHVITTKDVEAGVVTNVATASAAAPGGQIVAPPGYASVAIPTGKPAIIIPLPPVVFGWPDLHPEHPDSDEPAAGGAAVGGAVVGGAAAGGSGPGGGAGVSPGSGPGAAGPGTPNSQGGTPPSTGGQQRPSTGDQQRARPPVAVAGGEPDEPGHGGLTMVLLGAVTAAGALAALGVRAGRRTRRRR
ncbi:hypothetical protein [Frankia sp. R82]|uniref:DUF7507 domain-containing protein n=1 Tax=Frankia sp. R82 TaxID=2950553 RepID=UPI00204350E7|nr:hypothetical protein [Frankia sp. R82]MCM3887097.1 hypothetical protein [Frankia sp. R82]